MINSIFKRRKEHKGGTKLIIAHLAFIMFFDFILYPLPLMAKELSFKDYFSLQNSGLKSDFLNNYSCLATQTVAVSTKQNLKIEALPKLPVAEKAVLPEISLARGKDHGYHQMTAYNSEAAQTDSDPCTTANGFNVCKHNVEDTVAANFLKFGTKVKIPELFGDRVFIVRDRMNKRYPDRVDVWFKSRADALKFGVRTARIEVLEETPKEIAKK